MIENTTTAAAETTPRPRGTMLACHSKYMTREEIANLPSPFPMGPRHCPPNYSAFITELERALAVSGLEIVAEQWAVGRYRTWTNPATGEKVQIRNAMLHGLLNVRAREDAPADLLPPCADGVYCMGVRTSITQTHATTLIAGKRVALCDNLEIFSGENVVCKRKNTTGLTEAGALFETLADGVERWLGVCFRLEEALNRLKSTAITDTQAEAFVARAVYERVLAGKYVRPILTNWHQAIEVEHLEDMADCNHQTITATGEGSMVMMRTLYGLYSCITRVLRDCDVAQKIEASTKLGKFLGM